MKHFTLLSLALGLTLGANAQNGPVDFEVGGFGASWTWTTFENATNPPVQIIANPDMTGANTSSTVASFEALVGGNPWAGCETMHGADVGTFVLTPATSEIKIMVWKPVISDVGIKLVDASSGSLGEIKIANTLINQWEEITFDFTSREGITYDQIVIFPDFDLAGRTQNNLCYFDNLTFGAQSGGGPSVPMVAAPTPTEAPADVISMFSDAYTDVPVDTWQTPWSVAALSDIMVAGNPTKRYAALNFVGIETIGTQIDASGMNTFHVDMWTPDLTEFRVKLVDFGPNGVFDGPGVGDDTEHEITYANPTQNAWVELDIPLTDFAGLTSTNHISQLIFGGQPAGLGTVYIDNVYFSTTSGGGPSVPMVAAPTPTIPAAQVISLYSDAYTDVPVDTWQTVWSVGTLTDLTIAGNPTKLYENIDFVGVETVMNQINAAAMDTFHVDMWTANMTEFRVKIVDFGANGVFDGPGMGDDTEHEIVIANPAQNVWNSLSLPMADFTGLTTSSNISQFIFSGNPAGAGDVYIDNVYFSEEGTNSIVDASATAISVYPNPANNELMVSASSVIEAVNVFDMSGKLVLNAAPTSNQSVLNVQGLDAGSYVVQIQMENETIVRNFMKN